MMRTLCLRPMLLLLLGLSLASCKENSSTSTDTAAPADSSANASAKGTTGTPAPTAAKTTQVSVRFQGLVAHVLGDTIGKPSRSIVMKDKDHPINLFLPEDIDTTALKTVTGQTASKPSGGNVSIELPPGYSVRVVGWDAANKKVVSSMGGTLDASDASFDGFVPHLKKISGGDLDDKKLNPNVFNPYPAGDYALFFLLEGGTLTATKSCAQSHFIQDYDKEKTRDFASVVTLSGSVTEEPAIQFFAKGFADWMTVPFSVSPSGPVEFSIKATLSPTAPTGKSHFGIFKKIGTGSFRFDEIVWVACPPPLPHDLDPSCTNSQWP
jgi:hypothetical protein